MRTSSRGGMLVGYARVSTEDQRLDLQRDALTRAGCARIVTALQGRQVGFRSLQESIDTTTSGGKLIFHVFGALAEFERDLIRERTQAGLRAARARGRHGGRPRALDAKRLALARSLHQDPSHPVGEICRMLGISRATFYRYLAAPDESTGVDGQSKASTHATHPSATRSRPGRPRAKSAR